MCMTTFFPRNLSWLTSIAVLILLGAHVLLALSAVTGKSVTVDEIFHVTGGYLFNRHGDFRIHSDNGILPQRLQALPAVLEHANPPAFAGNTYWENADVSVVSHQFFYESGNDHWPILMGARIMNLGFSVGTALMVFFWARRLAGDMAGLTALGLIALSPTLLAHGALATSDTAAALLLTGSAGAFWWQLKHPSILRAMTSSLIFGLACVAKFSAVLLLPIFAILTVAHIFGGSPGAKRQIPGLSLGIICHGLLAWLIIWTFFGFRYETFAAGLGVSERFTQSWNWMLGQMGWQSSLINAMRRWHVLPEAFLFGYSHAYVGAQARSTFLAGDHSSRGWIEFFPLAFYWKATPAELAGLILAVCTAAVRWPRLRTWAVQLAPLLVFGIVYGVAALASHLNIGHRHLLPLYPGLCILIAVAAVRISSSYKIRGGLIAFFLCSQGIEAARTFPNYLAYFNDFSGGSANGWRLLVDSSLDWGQDLPALKKWAKLNVHPDDRFYLSYFGNGEPERYYGIHAIRMETLPDFNVVHPWYRCEPGIYAVSATMLQQVYASSRGNWTLESERRYQQLRLNEAFFGIAQKAPANSEIFSAVSKAEWEIAWRLYAQLRFARLCHYLRARQPDATAGYSILIYRVDQKELDNALNGDLQAWSAAIERQLTK